MREILFRAKRLKDKIWVEGSLLVLDADSGYYFITQPYKSASTLPVKDLIYNHTHLVDPKTVCQYTGRTDKNGVKIFEGDIVKDDVIFGAVVWDDPYIGFVIHDVNDGPQEYSSWWHEVEVIGNIFDNPRFTERRWR